MASSDVTERASGSESQPQSSDIFISYARENYDDNDTLLNRPDIEPSLDMRRLKLVPYDAAIKERI